MGVTGKHATGGQTTGGAVQHAANGIRALTDQPRYVRPRGQRTLGYYAALGRIVRGLDSGYASHVVKRLADALDQPGLGSNTLHKAARFAGAVEQKQLDLGLLEREGVSWRVASTMTSGNLPESRRQQLLDRVKNRRLDPRDLGHALHERLSPDATATTRSVVTAHQRARSAIGLLQRARARGHERAAAALAELKAMLDEGGGTTGS